MAWITISYRPGFAGDLTNWRTEISRDGRLTQVVEFAASATDAPRRERYELRLSEQQVRKLEQLVSRVDLAAAARFSKQFVVDDAEEMRWEIESKGQTFEMSAALDVMLLEQERGRLAADIPVDPTARLWHFIDWLSPYGLHRKPVQHPRTIAEAVDFLKKNIPVEKLALIRGAEPFVPVEEHFGLGMWVRNQLGLWGRNSELLRECGTSHPDDASMIILRALWEDLVATAGAEELNSSRTARRAFEAERVQQRQARMDAIAAADAAITDRRCPYCGQPCPSYRLTCKHCGKQVRTRRGS